VVTTFTEIVAGEMATVILVAGSVQETDEEALEVVAAVVVQVTAVLVAAVLLQEASPNAAANNANRERRFTAPRFSSAVARVFGILCSWRSISNFLPNNRNQILEIGSVKS
jgi:purine-cytosine permease-like protein